jgi:hypothetical protein
MLYMLLLEQIANNGDCKRLLVFQWKKILEDNPYASTAVAQSPEDSPLLQNAAISLKNNTNLAAESPQPYTVMCTLV